MNTLVAQPPAPPLNIATRVERIAAAQSAEPALICPAGSGWRKLSFSQLDERIRRCAAGLAAAGVRRGMRAIVMVRPGVDFFAVTFGLFRLGAVPVLIDPGMGRAGLVRSLESVRAEAFVGIALAQLVRIMHRRAFESIRIAVTVGGPLGLGGHRLDALCAGAGSDAPAADTHPDETAAILFTSGSTGPAKGVVYTHRNFDAQVECLREHYGCAPGQTDLATFPLFALFDAALGRTAVIPPMDASRPGRADPRRIVAALRVHDCTHMFASPALLTNLAEYLHAGGERLTGPRYVLSAGATVRADLLERLRAVLPTDAEIHTPYGATEALPITDIESRDVLGELRSRTLAGAGICVGRPLPHVELRIIEISDRPLESWTQVGELPPGRFGEIAVRGPVVTQSYFERPEADVLAKIADPRGGVWHRMGDVGYLDAEGRLWFCGRKAQRVVTASGPLFTESVEAVFNAHPRVRRTALVGVGPRHAQNPVLCVELRARAGRAERERIRVELLALGARHETTRSVRTIAFYPREFPVDVRHNAKIRREELAAWVRRTLGAPGAICGAT
jgi:acyl-CoA synthetase (AMP-forming)/AMP-acid ligase II